MPAEPARSLKKLLVALDETPASSAALDLAGALARTHGASLTGVAILDAEGLNPPEPVAIGAAHFKAQADRARLHQARERNARLRSQFSQRCQAEAVACDAVLLEGNRVGQVRGIAGTHDILVIGRDTDFRGEPDDEPADTVRQLLKDNPRPLIVTPQQVRDASTVVIAYDGSTPVARTLQLFVLLGLAGDTQIHIVSADPRQQDADRHAQQAASYLKAHGSEAQIVAVATSADPADIVCTKVRSVGAGLLVMGAFGHRGWREALLGSFTTRLLADCPAALFIHH
jgi:nucleotide-binding universal stress UspA family protein